MRIRSRGMILGAALAFGAVMAGCAQVAVAQQDEVTWLLEYPGDQVVIPVENDGRHSFASTMFGEAGPYNMIIDSGSTGNVIDTELAEELGLEVVRQQEVSSGGPETMFLDVVRMPVFQVGELIVTDAEFVTAPLGRMTGGRSFGVIGMNTFAEHLISFDQRANEVTVHQGALEPGALGVYSVNNERSPVDVNIDVVGQTINMHVDTGSPGGFTFPYELAETLPLLTELEEGEPARFVGMTRETWHAQLDGTITVAGVAYENPMVTFHNPSLMAGNLGNLISRDFILTVDQRNNLLAFTPHEEDGAPQDE